MKAELRKYQETKEDIDYEAVLKRLHGGVVSIIDSAATAEMLLISMLEKCGKDAGPVDPEELYDQFEMVNRMLNEIWEDSEILADLSDIGRKVE